ncbi:MAG: hypothetical protein WBF52_04130 [Geitlerinemataceae cyanobacterium]
MTPSEKISSPLQCQLDRVDALLLPVGSCQVGWRCQDGTVRSLGKKVGTEPDDDDRQKALLQELGMETVGTSFSESGNNWNWGEKFYRYCTDILSEDFSAVELLADESIVKDCIRSGLKRVVLWVTDSPDTLWFARLMLGKIRQHGNSLLQINVLNPIENPGNCEVDRLQSVLETQILPFALQDLIESDDPDRFVLAIRTSHRQEAISGALERCMVFLIRQCRVLSLSPLDSTTPKTESIDSSPELIPHYQISVLGGYAWSLDRPRTIAAWQRGWFQDAVIRLSAHPNYYGGLLYELAKRLTLLNRGEMHLFVGDRHLGIESWLQSPKLTQLIEVEQIEQWREQLVNLRTHAYAQAWEALFAIEGLLQQGHYTRGFLHFAQTLEQLLYLQYKSQDWLAQGLLPALDRPKGTTNNYQPGIKQLISAWCKATRQEKQGSIYRLFDRIGNTRNAILHYGGAIPFDDLLLVWSTSGMPVEFTRPQYIGLMVRMRETLILACDRRWKVPEQTLGQALSQWGLELLLGDN